MHSSTTSDSGGSSESEYSDEPFESVAYFGTSPIYCAFKESQDATAALEFLRKKPEDEGSQKHAFGDDVVATYCQVEQLPVEYLKSLPG